MRTALVLLSLSIFGACVEPAQEATPAPQEDPGKGDGGDRICQYEAEVGWRAARLVEQWAPTAPKFPLPETAIPNDPQPYHWRVAHVAEANDAGWVISVRGHYSWTEDNYLEMLLVFDANGEFVYSIPGRYIAHLTTDRFLMSQSRAKWSQRQSDRDPFYRREAIKVVRRDGELVQIATIQGNVNDSCGKFTRSAEDVVWNGRCDDNRDSVVVFRPYPRTGAASTCPIF